MNIFRSNGNSDCRKACLTSLDHNEKFIAVPNNITSLVDECRIVGASLTMDLFLDHDDPG